MEVQNYYEKDLYPSVKRILKNRYKKQDGWEVIPQAAGRDNTYIPDYIVSRKVNKNKKQVIEKVVCEVKRNKLTNNDVAQLNGYCSKISGNGIELMGKFFAIPSGTDTSILSSIKNLTIQKIFIRNFPK